MKMKKFIGLLCSILLMVTMSLSVLANETTHSLSNEDISNLTFEFELDLSEYPKFDIDNYEEYLPIFEAYNVDIDSIIAVIPASELFDGHVNEHVAPYQWQIPGGIVVITGTYLSPYIWQLGVLNAGVLVLDYVEADVKLFRSSNGIMFNTIRNLSPIGRGIYVSETYNIANYEPISFAHVTLTCRTSAGEWFNTGGTHTR